MLIRFNHLDLSHWTFCWACSSVSKNIYSFLKKISKMRPMITTSIHVLQFLLFNASKKLLKFSQPSFLMINMTCHYHTLHPAASSTVNATYLQHTTSFYTLILIAKNHKQLEFKTSFFNFCLYFIRLVKSTYIQHGSTHMDL